MEEWILQLNNSLVVAPYSEHSFFLMLKNKYPDIDFKLTTKEEIIKSYYGKVEDDYFYTWYFYHQNIPFEVAKLYYKMLNLPLINNDNVKVKEMFLFRQDLIDKGVIKPVKYYSNMLKKYKILLFDYLENDKELINIFHKENINYSILSRPLIKNSAEVIYFEHIDDEITYMFQEIMRLYYEEKVPLSKIFIYSPSKEYYYPLIKIAMDFKIPLEEGKNNSYYSLLITKELIDYYRIHNEVDSYNATSLLEKEIKLLMIEQINKYRSLFALDNFLLILKDYFQKKKLPKDHYQDEIYFTSRHHFLDDEYVFVLGFEQGKMPSIKKDDDYFLDSVKAEMNLSTSDDKNKEEIEKIKCLVFENKNVYISYKQKCIDGVCYPSLLIGQWGLKVSRPINRLISYSLKHSQIEYGRILDLERKYGIRVKDREKYYSLGNILYRTYDFAFKGTNIIKKDDCLIHSYSRLKVYAQCPYHYYLDSVLHLNPFEDSSSLKFGNLVHYIMEYGVEGLSFEEAYDKSYQKFMWTDKEKVLLLEIKKIVEELFINNSHFVSKMVNPRIYVENTFNLKLHEKAFLTGKIDKIILTGNNNENISIIDYKTGTEKIKLEELQYGFSMQLPIYSLLLKADDNFKDLDLLGVYIQPVLPQSPIASSKKTKTPIAKEQMLQGYTLYDRAKISLFDPNYMSSQLIKSMKVCQNGNFSNNTKLFNKEEWNRYEDIVYKVILDFDDRIRHNDFKIAPVLLNNQSSCSFCPYKDICYVNKSQFVVINTSNEKGDDENEE